MASNVDIVIITYNQEEFIEPCIRSAVEQTAHNVRITIIDDCSSDRTPEIAEALARQCGNARFLRNEKNLGERHTSNKAFATTNGDYFLLLHGDDLLHPRFVEETVNNGLEKHPSCSFSYALASRIVGGEVIDDLYQFIPRLATGPHDLLPYLCFTNWISPSFGIMRRSACEKFGAIQSYIDKKAPTFLDHYMYSRLAAHGDCYVVSERLGQYRIHDKQTSSVIRQRMNEYAIVVYDLIFSDVEHFDVKHRYMAKANQIGRLLTMNGIARTVLEMIRSPEIAPILRPTAAALLTTIADTLGNFTFDSSRDASARNFQLEDPRNLDVLRSAASKIS
ncbi:MAG: glycosyltransferase family 2 protein [Rhodocyclaceae bacterium]|nr:glycosyltransferase family 2 protein [Rhodocyclaceae bacterium]